MEGLNNFDNWYTNPYILKNMFLDCCYDVLKNV